MDDNIACQPGLTNRPALVVEAFGVRERTAQRAQVLHDVMGLLLVVFLLILRGELNRGDQRSKNRHCNDASHYSRFHVASTHSLGLHRPRRETVKVNIGRDDAVSWPRFLPLTG